MSLCQASRLIYHYAECRYAECRLAECHYAECRVAFEINDCLSGAFYGQDGVALLAAVKGIMSLGRKSVSAKSLTMFIFNHFDNF